MKSAIFMSGPFLWSLNTYAYIQINTFMWVCVYIHLTSHMPVRGGLHAGHPKTGTRGRDESSGRVMASKSKFPDPLSQ